MSFANAATTLFARVFKLINNFGVTVAQLDNKLNRPSLQMNHLDHTEYNDSRLAWSTGAPRSTQFVQLLGPSTLLGATPFVNLTTTVASGDLVSQLLAGDGTSTNVAVVSAEYVESTNAANVTLSTVNGTGSSINLNSSGFISMRSIGSVTVTSGTTTTFWSTGNFFIQASVDINLNPTGHVAVNGRQGYLCINRSEFAASNLNPIPAYASFLINGLSFTGKPGDIITMTAHILVQNNNPAVNNTFRAFFQLYGPTGNVVTGSRLYVAQPGGYGFTQVTGTAVITLALGSGTYAATLVGGMQAGSAIGYDPVLTIDVVASN